MGTSSMERAKLPPPASPNSRASSPATGTRPGVARNNSLGGSQPSTPTGGDGPKAAGPAGLLHDGAKTCFAASPTRGSALLGARAAGGNRDRERSSALRAGIALGLVIVDDGGARRARRGRQSAGQGGAVLVLATAAVIVLGLNQAIARTRNRPCSPRRSTGAPRLEASPQFASLVVHRWRCPPSSLLWLRVCGATCLGLIAQAGRRVRARRGSGRGSAGRVATRAAGTRAFGRCGGSALAPG